MAKFKVGDKVVVSKPKDWPNEVEFKLDGAEGTVQIWVDWPEVMDPYAEYVQVGIEKTPKAGKLYEGANLIFNEKHLKKAAKK